MAIFRKQGESLLGQPIGIEESRVRQERDFEERGAFQNAARYRRVARRGYRNALRSGNMKEAMDSLDWLEKKGQTLGSGIGLAGQREAVARNPAGAPVQDPSISVFNPVKTTSFADKSPKDQNLDMRLGLFAQMKDALVNGGSLKDYWEDAQGLGVTAAGFGNAMERAQRETFGSAVDPLARNGRSFGQGNPDAKLEPGLFAFNNPNAGAYNPTSPNPHERAAASSTTMPVIPVKPVEWE